MKYRRKETKDEVVARIAAMTCESVSDLRLFAKISAPENRHLFTKEAVFRAFAHEEAPLVTLCSLPAPHRPD
ncbi:hypothetical protein [Polaromonas sp. OV174]|uniref:hypothetical protein n=1 Tax=Polaromonas sp. OV174 TaxID=1855300 RepID=UPI0015A5EDF7|nr:hypothetical protein [Polaromonas sp. OV174]